MALKQPGQQADQLAEPGRWRVEVGDNAEFKPVRGAVRESQADGVVELVLDQRLAAVFRALLPCLFGLF